MIRVLALGAGLALPACTGPSRPIATQAEPVVRDPWIRVRDRGALEAALAAADPNAPVVLDVSATWCVPCVELRDVSFADRRVVAALTDHVRIELDVSDGTDEHALLQAWLGYDAVPHVVRFASARSVVDALRRGAKRPPVTLELRSFVSADELLAALAR